MICEHWSTWLRAVVLHEPVMWRHTGTRTGGLLCGLQHGCRGPVREIVARSKRGNKIFALRHRTVVSDSLFTSPLATRSVHKSVGSHSRFSRNAHPQLIIPILDHIRAGMVSGMKKSSISGHSMVDVRQIVGFFFSCMIMPPAYSKLPFWT